MADMLPENETISLREQIDVYLRNWVWFGLAVLVALALAFIYLRYATPQYSTTATILIKDENNSQLSELAAFEDLGLAGGGLTKSAFENEMEIISSKKLAREVVDRLDLNIAYFRQGNVITSEVFGNIPFEIKILSDESLISQPLVLTIRLIDNNSFDLAYAIDDVLNSKTISYGESFGVEDMRLIVLPNDISDQANSVDEIDREYLVRLSSIRSAVDNLKKSIIIQGASKNSSVVTLSTTMANKLKAETILNTLIEVYNEDASQDKNLVSRNTANFIEKRLAIISGELDSVEAGKATFKQDRRLTDLESEGKLFLENISEFNRRKTEVETQIELIEAIKTDLTDQAKFNLIPVNLGIEKEGLSLSIRNYNDLVLKRNSLLRGATEENPTVVALSTQIEQLRDNIVSSLTSVASSLNISRRELDQQERELSGKVSQIPSVEREIRDIERQQNIKESLYLYLLQKREETAISLAVTTPKAKIVDSASSSILPVSPKKSIVLLAALILGLLVPFGIIYLKQLLDTKIHNRLDIERLLPELPILGEIPQIDSKDGEMIKSNDRSTLAEAFRILRTNLSYFVSTKKGNGKKNNVIYVTSTVKGEGKTFVAFNLALSLRTTGKTVLLIGADIRNPQIHRYIGKPEGQKGLSEYLYDESITPDTVTTGFEINRNQLDVILSGRIPPNPAELLMSDRFKTLIDGVKDQYDYVVVDTAPTMLVTDTLLISQYADLTVYVSRAEYTDRKLLQFAKDLNEQQKLINMAYVVNDVNQANFGYGTKYGYGYGVEKDSFFKRLKKGFRS